MKQRRKVIFTMIFLSFFLLIKADAQENKTLSLNEAIHLGITNSKQLKLSKARIDEAVAATKQAEEARLPDASISGSYVRLTRATVDLKTTSGSGMPSF